MNHRAKPLPTDWPTRRAYVPQGVDQQGRLTPSIPFGGCPCAAGKSACDCGVAQPAPAEACTHFGFESQADSADMEVAKFCVKWAAIVLGLLLLLHFSDQIAAFAREVLR